MARTTTIPVRVKQKRPIEKFIYLVAIIEPLMSLSQVIQIYKKQIGRGRLAVDMGWL